MTLALPTSYRVLGAVPLGEGVVDKPTKRRESALLAGAIRRATWLGSEGGGKAFPLASASKLSYATPSAGSNAARNACFRITCQDLNFCILLSRHCINKSNRR